MSIDENGMEDWSPLMSCNELDMLIGAAERRRKRTGHYLERAMADKIHRNRENLAFCKLHGICLFGLSLGHPKKDAVIGKKTE